MHLTCSYSSSVKWLSLKYIWKINLSMTPVPFKSEHLPIRKKNFSKTDLCVTFSPLSMTNADLHKHSSKHNSNTHTWLYSDSSKQSAIHHNTDPKNNIHQEFTKRCAVPYWPMQLLHLLHITSTTRWDSDSYSDTEAQQHRTSLWFYCKRSKTKADEKNHTALSHGPDHSVHLSAASPPHKDQSLSHPAPKRTIKHNCTCVHAEWK